jgi:exopolysaccharide biosynthesis polyprenyl glycosylphosphotransferase
VSVEDAFVSPQVAQTPASDEPSSAAPFELVDERTRELIERRRLGKSRHRGWLVRRALAVADVVGILLAFCVTQLAFSGNDVPVDRISTRLEVLLFTVTLPAWIVLARVYGLYSNDERRADHSGVDDLFGVFNMLTVGAWLLFSVGYAIGFVDPSFPKLALFWVTAIVLVFAGRTIARAACRRTDAYVQNTLIVGAGRVGQRVARKLLQHPEYGVNVVGFVDDSPRERDDGLGDLTVLGTPHDVPALVEALDIERVIVAFLHAPHEEMVDLVRELNGLGAQVDIVPRLFDAMSSDAHVHAAEGLPLLGMPPAQLSRSSLLLKRAFDLVIASLGLVLLSPFLGAIAVAVKIDSPGPVLFRQVRMGRGGRRFEILKFRTMAVDADARKAEVEHLNKHLRPGGDARMFKIPGDPRVTRVGAFLRRYSLDELPQLLNVLSGEMSLVGPRPLILDEDKHVDGWGRKRLDLKPGITGLWQVLGRDGIPFEEMVLLDYRYVTSWSLAGDLKLIAKTIPMVTHPQEG